MASASWRMSFVAGICLNGIPNDSTTSRASSWLLTTTAMSVIKSPLSHAHSSSSRQWGSFDTKIAVFFKLWAYVNCQFIENVSAIFLKLSSSFTSLANKSSHSNSKRIKNIPPSWFVECWLDSTIFAPCSCKNVDTAATIPGLSGQLISSRPRFLYFSLYEVICFWICDFM